MALRSTETIVKTTCPRDCYDSCGMSVVKRGERIQRITGDPAHFVSRGKLCAKCSLAYNGAWIDPERRLLRPLRRAGKKGSGTFVSTTWDEALRAIADRLRPITDGGRADRVLQTHYTGTCTALAGNFPLRFFRRLGATEVDPDTVCNKAGHQALIYVLGDSCLGFDPRSAADAACVLVWGANPSASAPHVHRHWLPEAPGKKIVIDPIAHATALEADLFLQPRPGTDAALAYGLIAAARDADLLDLSFAERHTLGWQEVLAVADGTPVASAAKATGVPEALIREAAAIYAPGPSLMWLGQGMQRQWAGGNAFRAAASLCALTGNIGKAGAGLLFLNGPASRGLDVDYVGGAHLAAAAPSPISQMDLADALADPGRSEALFCWNNNIVASNPAQSALRRALTREDLLHVVVDLFQTDTADFADFVLPAASFLEFDDLLSPYFHLALSAQVKAAEPFGESLPNQEIFRRLSRCMGFDEPEMFESDQAIIDRLLRGAGFPGNFEDLARKGTVFLREEPLQPFADLVFPTPSGRIELACERAAADGHPRVPTPHADPSPEDRRLRVLSPASAWTMNSSYANDAGIGKQLGPATVYLHPSEATERGLSDGDLVTLSNTSGSLQAAVSRTSSVPPGVALLPKGRWIKSAPEKANVNVLNPGRKSDMGESSCVHSVEAYLTGPSP